MSAFVLPVCAGAGRCGGARPDEVARVLNMTLFHATATIGVESATVAPCRTHRPVRNHTALRWRPGLRRERWNTHDVRGRGRVTGGALSAQTVIIVGLANLFADGLSMGVGNYLSIRARESALERQQRPEEEARPARHGVATFLAFVIAGAMPLVPYLAPTVENAFPWAIGFALAAQFGVGAARSLVTASRWWVSGSKCWVSARWSPPSPT